jgi:hypothetical protein
MTGSGSTAGETPAGGMTGSGQTAGGMTGGQGGRARNGRWTLLAIFLVCVAPVIATYYTYLVIRPDGRTNYGELMEPFHDVASLAGVELDGTPTGLAALHGRWIMITGSDGVCDTACERRLYLMRQVRLTTGKNRDRVERAWIVPSDATPDPGLLAQHEGLVVIRAAPGAMRAAGFAAAAGVRPEDHIWIVDPHGKLVLRYPVAADPSRMKKDLLKLLSASSIG